MAEQATPDYMSELAPDATMRQVFDDLYERGDMLASGLREGVVTGRHPLGSRLSNTPVDLRNEYGFSTDDATDREYRWIHADSGTQHRSLYYLAEDGPARADSESPAPTTPSIIAAFRSGQLLMPTYSLNLRADGTVVSGIESHIRMFEPDKTSAGYGRDQLYIGDSEHDSQAKVADLDDREQKRLRLITNAITWGIVRTEMLRDGADFNELFDIKPEPETKQPPKRSFSLRWLLGGSGGSHQPA